MALDFSGVDTQAQVNSLVAKLNALAAEYASLTTSATVSDQGRTIDMAKRGQAILDQMKGIRELLARMAGPVFTVSRMRP